MPIKRIKILKEELEAKEVRLKGWQLKVQEVIYGTTTPSGKLFDILLLLLILFSILAIMLESVAAYKNEYRLTFLVIEYVVTGLFTIEYILRIVSVKQPLKYIFSFFGIIDLLSILPTYLGLFISGSKPLTVVRAIRFLRIFRILELSNFTKGANTILQALYDSRHKIIVFIVSMLTIVIILGAIMFSVESAESGFTSIPRSIYWAIITITTVGYGDIAPATELGQAIASIIMLIGYSIIAVPTGIVSAEIIKGETSKIRQFSCPSCQKTGHTLDALYCKYCGHSFKKDPFLEE
jgi:voltage-gated potassium channel